MGLKPNLDAYLRLQGILSMEKQHAGITAEEARRIANENLRGPAIEKFVRVLDDRVKRAAAEGKGSVDPWLTLGQQRMPGPTPDEKLAIEQWYRQRGFGWKDHPNPDPGHPASRPYTTLSW